MRDSARGLAEGPEALRLDRTIGTLESGKYADLMVIGGDSTKPYDALLAVTPRDVRMTMVNGRILYGDEVLHDLMDEAQTVMGSRRQEQSAHSDQPPWARH